MNQDTQDTNGQNSHQVPWNKGKPARPAAASWRYSDGEVQQGSGKVNVREQGQERMGHA